MGDGGAGVAAEGNELWRRGEIFGLLDVDALECPVRGRVRSSL
jgi:hypothetical protein